MVEVFVLHLLRLQHALEGEFARTFHGHMHDCWHTVGEWTYETALLRVKAATLLMASYACMQGSAAKCKFWLQV